MRFDKERRIIKGTLGVYKRLKNNFRKSLDLFN